MKRAGTSRRRVTWVFGLQLIAVVIVLLMGAYNVAPLPAVVVLIVFTTLLAWLAMRREWRPVRALARIVSRWDAAQSREHGTAQLEQLSTHADADVASLARGMLGFVTRISGYNQRERNFTRDASHELRSPLTIIKMSIDMLAEEEGLSDFGARSIRRIKRASLEMEALVEALLVLARESDAGVTNERFVVNDVLHAELDSARELLKGRPIELSLQESAKFALQGSPQAFSVLCWQLIRNACQQTEQGAVVISVTPGLVSVSNRSTASTTSAGTSSTDSADRHGFELAIAQRISERFAWPLELQSRPGEENIASIRFPHPLPAEQESEVPGAG
jgi:signal transduction histidine kinase